jgi:hypothetical protein
VPSRVCARLQRLGDAEVDQLHAAVEADEDVRRRDVAMHDAERLARRRRPSAPGERQRARRLGGDVKREPDRRCAVSRRAREHRAEVAPVDVLEHEVELGLAAAPLLAELEHLGDVRVMQRRADARLADEAAPKLGVGGALGEYPLDNKGPLELVRSVEDRAPHLGHAATTDALDEAIAPNPLHGYAAWASRSSRQGTVR